MNKGADDSYYLRAVYVVGVVLSLFIIDAIFDYI